MSVFLESTSIFTSPECGDSYPVRHDDFGSRDLNLLPQPRNWVSITKIRVAGGIFAADVARMEIRNLYRRDKFALYPLE
jgi:hypothetical protein